MNIQKKLKDPKCYEEIERQLYMPSSHKHRKVAVWQKCKECQGIAKERAKKMRELGFKDAREYMEWKRIMGQMMIIKKINEEKEANKSE